jgi:membrane protein YqaA with SNARE-associated domain
VVEARPGVSQGYTRSCALGVARIIDSEDLFRGVAVVRTVVEQLLGGLAGLSPVALYGLAGLFLVLETTLFIGLLVPGDVVLLLAGSTVSDPGAFGLLIAAAMLGSLGGESLGYLLGRRLGDRVRTSRLGRRLGRNRWAKADRFFGRGGGRAVFMARFVPGISALVPGGGRHRRDAPPAFLRLVGRRRHGVVGPVRRGGRGGRGVLPRIRGPAGHGRLRAPRPPPGCGTAGPGHPAAAQRRGRGAAAPH